MIASVEGNLGESKQERGFAFVLSLQCFKHFIIIMTYSLYILFC